MRNDTRIVDENGKPFRTVTRFKDFSDVIGDIYQVFCRGIATPQINIEIGVPMDRAPALSRGSASGTPANNPYALPDHFALYRAIRCLAESILAATHLFLRFCGLLRRGWLTVRRGAGLFARWKRFWQARAGSRTGGNISTPVCMTGRRSTRSYPLSGGAPALDPRVNSSMILWRSCCHERRIRLGDVAHPARLRTGRGGTAPLAAKSGSPWPLVVMVTPAIDAGTRRSLSDAGCVIREVPILGPDPALAHRYANARFAEVWSKLAVWTLEEYQRVAFLDADMLVVQNMDELFELPLPTGFIAACHACRCNPNRIASYPESWQPENCYYTWCEDPQMTAHPPHAG
jgi:hypothetical protein